MLENSPFGQELSHRLFNGLEKNPIGQLKTQFPPVVPVAKYPNCPFEQVLVHKRVRLSANGALDGQFAWSTHKESNLLRKYP